MLHVSLNSFLWHWMTDMELDVESKTKVGGDVTWDQWNRSPCIHQNEFIVKSWWKQQQQQQQPTNEKHKKKNNQPTNNQPNNQPTNHHLFTRTKETTETHGLSTFSSWWHPMILNDFANLWFKTFRDFYQPNLDFFCEQFLVVWGWGMRVGGWGWLSFCFHLTSH